MQNIQGWPGWLESIKARTSKPCGCWQSTWTGSAQGGQEKGKGKWLRGYAAERPALPTGPPAPAGEAESACSALKGGAVRPGGGVPGRARPSQESDALDLPGRLGLWIFAASHREDARGGLPISPLRLPTPRPPLQGLFAPAPLPRGVPPRPDPPARGKAGGKTCGSAREDAGEIPPRKRPPGKENMGRLTRFRKTPLFSEKAGPEGLQPAAKDGIVYVTAEHKCTGGGQCGGEPQGGGRPV